MSISKRISAAAAIATAIAMPAEGLRQYYLRKPERLNLSCTSHKATIDSL